MSTTTQQNTEVSDKAQQAIDLINKAVNNSITGVTFVSIKGYENKDGEIADHLFNVGINYEKSKQADILFLESLDVTKLENVKSNVIDLELAKVALIEAFKKPNENRSNGQKDAYTHIGFGGLKVHNETGYLYLYGYRQNKKIIKEGTYKEVKSSALTIAKNELRKLLKTGKFKQFSVAIGNTLKASGTTLEI